MGPLQSQTRKIEQDEIVDASGIKMKNIPVHSVDAPDSETARATETVLETKLPGTRKSVVKLLRMEAET